MNAATQHLELREHEELRLLYQTSAADIAFFKQQQWSISNYALTAQAAIVFIAYQVFKSPLSATQATLLVFLSLGLSAMALLAIERLKNSIKARRTRLERIREHFGQVFTAAWTVPKENDDFHALLRIVLCASGFVSAWLVLARPS